MSRAEHTKYSQSAELVLIQRPEWWFHFAPVPLSTSLGHVQIYTESRVLSSNKRRQFKSHRHTVHPMHNSMENIQHLNLTKRGAISPELNVILGERSLRRAVWYNFEPWSVTPLTCSDVAAAQRIIILQMKSLFTSQHQNEEARWHGCLYEFN